MPKNEDIQRIFSAATNSPIDKIRHISVINSYDNFEEEKKSDFDEYKRSLREGNSEGTSLTGPEKSSKAAVPILDFTNLPSDKKIKSITTLSHEELFDKDSHLDLSSKRIKKLILTSDFSSLLNIREEVINQKADKEKNEIDHLLNTQMISPRTGNARTLKLEKWISKEKEDIKRTKQIIAEAKKKTEDIIKEAEINNDIFKQMISEKVATPREGLSVRSGMNSERRRYEKMQKTYSDHESDPYENDKSSALGRELSKSQEYPFEFPAELEKDIDEMIEKFGNKEIDISRQKMIVLDRSDNDVLVSVETPEIADDDNSAFEVNGKMLIGPQHAEGDSSTDSIEDIAIDKKPISLEVDLEVDLKDDSSSSKEDQQPDLGVHSLSRKKSEQRLTEIDSKIRKDQINKVKSTITPTPLSKPSLINPFNSDNFFTQNFDDQEMEAAIEQLKNSSGKMGLPSKGDGVDSVELLVDHKDFNRRDIDKIPSKQPSIIFRPRFTIKSR
jgi:hypothetical protein